MLRAAVPADSELIWRIRNEETARTASIDAELIPLEDHERWWRRRLVDPSSAVYIASLPDGRPAGYVRFALDGDEASISVALDEGVRGRGYGTEAIRLGCAEVLATGPAQRIVALVKGENEASLRAFRRVGFVERRRLTVARSEVVELVLDR
jgi:RimJ/RimL family protein N-acetyltransferase